MLRPKSTNNLPTTYEELLPEYLAVTHELAQLKRMIFGQKRERFVPSVPEEQMSLEDLFEHA